MSLPASAQHDHGAPTPVAAREEAAQVLYTPEDLQFLSHMIVHHQQALDLCALVAARSPRADFVRFARYVSGAQAAEIRIMQGLLELAAERGLSASAHDHAVHADPPMAGMLSAAEMAALAATSGGEFERLWLEGMIFHHEGGLAMARVQELEQARRRRQPYGLGVLVDEILVVQRAEITQMRAWLDDWGLAADGADARPPAVETTTPAPGVALRVGREARIRGVVADDRAVESVRVGLKDPVADRWLHRDGTWGARELYPADLVASGPASAAWSFTFTPHAVGRYEVRLEAEDAAGKRSEASNKVIYAE